MSAPAVPAAARVAAPGRRRRRGAGTPWALLAPTLILLTALFCVPVVYNVWLALHKVTPYDALGEGQWVGLKNFAAVLGNPQTWLNGRNTIVWLTLVTVVLRIGFGLALAMLLQAPVLGRRRASRGGVAWSGPTGVTRADGAAT